MSDILVEGVNKNKKVIDAKHLIVQGELEEAKKLLQEAINGNEEEGLIGFREIINGNQENDPNHLGYQTAKAAERNKAVAEKLLQEIQEDQKGKGTARDNIGVALREEKSTETRTSPKYGGIDLTTVDSTLQIKRDENGVPLPLPLQNIQNIHLDGLKFIILNTASASLNDFPFLISLKEK